MTNHSLRRRRLLIAAGTLAVLSACSGSSSSGSTSAAATDAPSGSATATTAAPDDSVAADVELSEVSGPGDFLLPDPLVGLADLSSYRATLTVSFDGTDGEAALQWTSTTVMIRVAESSAAVTIENAGDMPAAEPAYLAELNGIVFRRDAAGACTAEIGDPDASLLDVFEPAAELAGVIGAEPAGTKTIGSVDALGYTFDERAVGQTDLGHTTGEVWVAADTGLVLSYSMTSQGGADLFGDGVDGSISWAYELTDVNAAAAPDLADECRSGLLGTPTPDGATGVVNTSDLLSFETALTVADALAFYEQAAFDLGWTAIGAQNAETEGTAEYQAGDKVVSIFANVGDAGTHVDIMLGDAPSAAGGGGGGGGGGPGQGQATFEMHGAHESSATWEFAPQFSAFGGGSWRISFTDPANPLPTGSFLTLVLTPGDENLSFSDGAATIIAGTDVCAFAIDHQDAGGTSGTIQCTGAQAMGTGGSIDVTITFSATT
ncbi:MAG TPA: hypothetical protein VH761_17750 [Ilumatobacteraceae bacterium]|jgi:hypothetical protein